MKVQRAGKGHILVLDQTTKGTLEAQMAWCSSVEALEKTLIETNYANYWLSGISGLDSNTGAYLVLQHQTSCHCVS